MLLKLLEPTHVHIMMNKTIIKNGHKELINEILEKGFAEFSRDLL